MKIWLLLLLVIRCGIFEGHFQSMGVLAVEGFQKFLLGRSHYCDSSFKSMVIPANVSSSMFQANLLFEIAHYFVLIKAKRIKFYASAIPYWKFSSQKSKVKLNCWWKFEINVGWRSFWVSLSLKYWQNFHSEILVCTADFWIFHTCVLKLTTSVFTIALDKRQ